VGERTCSAEGCDRRVKARGLCMSHYGSLHRAGGIPRLPDPVTAFWAHVAKAGPDECWPWTGCRLGYGHGQGTAEGRRFLAHRRSWELTYGPIPAGIFVCHRCDPPPCCNPAHLFLGTNAENVADMDAKGRRVVGGLRFGVGHHSAKLDPERVRAIRRRHAAGEESAALAREYGVTRAAVYFIVTRQSWKAVE
jgi:hypothetical protein